jgi:probable phosphoglycerate mutase
MGALQMPSVSFETHNTSITHWQQHKHDSRNLRRRWYLVKYNDDMHLRDMNAPVRIPWQELSRPVIGTAQAAIPVEDE